MEHETWGQLLARHRSAAGLSVRGLAALADSSRSSISRWEADESIPNRDTAGRLDQATGADGALTRAHHRMVPATPRSGDMRRRTVVAGIAGLATTGVLGREVAVEATRLGLASARGTDIVAWDHAMAAIARMVPTASPAELMTRVQRQLIILQAVITEDPDSRDLRRLAAELSVVMAMALGRSGDPFAARVWWKDASAAAEESGCPRTIALARGRHAVGALYGPYQVPELLAIAAAPAGPPCSGTSELLGGRAQLYARLGRRAEAERALGRLADAYAALPPEVTTDDGLFGWREYRLHHATSWVYTHLGDTASAYAAQDRALAIYPPGMVREAALVRLHRARCLIADRDIGEGLTTAMGAIDSVPESVPPASGIGLLATEVLAALPDGERGRPAARALADRLRIGRALM